MMRLVELSVLSGENFRSSIEIANLVGISGLNHRKLHRGFIELFGVAPMQFITRTRIEAACDDLLTTKKKLSEIAKRQRILRSKFLYPTFQEANESNAIEIQKQKGYA